MMPMRRPRFARCLLPFFLLLCALFCVTAAAEEQFTPTTDLDNFQKLQQQKEQAEVKPEVQAAYAGGHDRRQPGRLPARRR